MVRVTHPKDRKGATADLEGGRSRRLASEMRLPPPVMKIEGAVIDLIMWLHVCCN